MSLAYFSLLNLSLLSYWFLRLLWFSSLSLTFWYRNKYGVIQKIRSDTIEVPPKRIRDREGSGYYSRYDNTVKKAKIEVIITRHKDFFKNIEEFEKEKALKDAQNQELEEKAARQAEGALGSEEKTSANSFNSKVDYIAAASG